MAGAVTGDVAREAYPERIIFAIDKSSEMNVKVGGPNQPLRLAYISQCIEMFCVMKQSVSPQHQFAVCSYDTSVKWHTPLTKDIGAIRAALKRITVSTTPPAGPFDMNMLIKSLCEQQTLNGLRIVLIFGRIMHVPHLDLTDPGLIPCLSSERFAMDAIFIHGKSPDAQTIYDLIVTLDNVGGRNNYFFEAAKQTKRLWAAFFALLAHPAQRPPQTASRYEDPLFVAPHPPPSPTPPPVTATPKPAPIFQFRT